jgi:hypothetical protein
MSRSRARASVRTIVEDGHQYWRSYFHHDGRYTVHPLSVPVYQDAVLSTTYRRTLRAQFTQLRRWAWGASDVAYVAEKGYFTANRVPKRDVTVKFLRLLVAQVMRAAAPPVLVAAPIIAALASGRFLVLAGVVKATGLVGVGIAIWLGADTLAAETDGHGRRRRARLALEWTLLPVTALVYNTVSAMNAQTRLMLGRRLETFDLTEKAVVTEIGTRSAD